jgi:ubiquinone/menaquinone biosynthesis C-methylase UbiE
MPMRNPEMWEATLARTLTHLAPDASVLELGCGTGSTALRLAPHVARYVGTDDAAAMVSIARERLADAPTAGLSFEQARPGDLSLPEGPFDVIVAFNLLHLLPDPPGALAEARDHLTPGGLLITKTPCLGGRYLVLWPLVRVLRLFGKAPALRFLTTERLEGLITKSGFVIIERSDHPARPPSRYVVAERS